MSKLRKRAILCIGIPSMAIGAFVMPEIIARACLAIIGMWMIGDAVK